MLVMTGSLVVPVVLLVLAAVARALHSRRVSVPGARDRANEEDDTEMRTALFMSSSDSRARLYVDREAKRKKRCSALLVLGTQKSKKVLMRFFHTS